MFSPPTANRGDFYRSVRRRAGPMPHCGKIMRAHPRHVISMSLRGGPALSRGKDVRMLTENPPPLIHISDVQVSIDLVARGEGAITPLAFLLLLVVLLARAGRARTK